MRNLAIFIVMTIHLMACSPTLPPPSETLDLGRAKGELRGIDKMEEHLYERILVSTGRRRIPLEQILGPSLEPLVGILGQTDTNGSRNEFRNGEPNPMNMMIWFSLMRQISISTGAYCTGMTDTPLLHRQTELFPGMAPRNNDLLLTDRAAAEFKKFCEATEDRRDSARRVFDMVIGYEAPESAFDTWWAVYEEAEPAEALEGIFMNPFLLLVN